MAIKFRDILARASTARNEMTIEHEPKIIFIATIDQLKAAFERERSKLVHEQIERDKVDDQYRGVTKEYNEITAEIDGRIAEINARATAIQMQIIEALKHINIIGEIHPLIKGK